MGSGGNGVNPGRTADVVVVGGGIVGLSIAYQLARRGAGRVVVLEKGGSVGQGSTGASSACLRLRYTQDPVVRLAQSGLAIYRQWAAFTGLASPRAGFAPTGVLWMLNEDDATVRSECERLAALDARVAMLDAKEVRERFPVLSTCGAALAMDDTDHDCADHDRYFFEEEGGYCTDPAGAAQDLMDAAVAAGADVRLRQPLTDVRTRGGRVEGVTLADGTKLDAPLVLNAAGPWCNRINALAGVDLGWTLRPTRIQVMFRVLVEENCAGLPLVADASGGIYFRPESGGQQLLVGSIRNEDELELVDPDAYDGTLDEEMRAKLLHALHHRLPGLPHRGRVSGLAGLYTITDEDMHPVVGPTGLEGFWVANGFSGHGFKLAPAVGALVARAITGRSAELDPDVPIEFLSVERDALVVREKSVMA